MWYTYILKSSKRNWHYVGSSNDLGRRLNEHNALKVISTKSHAPLELIYSKEWPTEQEARSYERKIKKQRILKEQILKSIL